VNLYKENEECGDVVMLIFEDGKGQVYQTKNLHNFQRHKKEKYRDIKELVYFACMDVLDFKKEWSQMLKENRFREEEYIRLEKRWMEMQIMQILEKMHKKPVVRTEASYKTDYYLQCPFCEMNTENKTEMELHLLEKHKHLKYYKNMILLEDQKDKMMSIIEQKQERQLCLENGEEDFRCEFCHHQFSNKFNLRRHLKENCKNWRQFFKTRYQQ
jgi:hypothetical protein